MTNIRPISKELQQKAIDELNEDVSRIPKDIQAIREWLQQTKYITARTDDQFILTFLRGCKFSLERTKQKIESYYTMRTLLPEFSTNRDPFLPELQELLRRGQFLPMLNQKNPNTPRLFIHNANFDPNIIKKEDVVKLQTMIIDILLNEDDQMTISGMQYLLEIEGLKIGHIYPPTLTMKTLKYAENGIPSRIKGLHVYNMHPIFQSLLGLIRSFLSEKIRKRVLVHNMNNLEEFYKAIPKEELPKEYGGDGPTLQKLRDFWKQKVESYADWFKEDEKYRTNEKLRPGKPKTTQEMFGVEGVDGSFRKLNVD